MGLNIGIEVRKQPEGFMEHGSNPQMALPELEKDFFAFLYERFSGANVGPGGVSLERRSSSEEWYVFDVRMYRYGGAANDEAVYIAIMEYVFQHFSHVEGIEMRTYWSG